MKKTELLVVATGIENREAKETGRPYSRITWYIVSGGGTPRYIHTNEGRDMSRPGTRKRWAMMGRLAGMRRHMDPNDEHLVQEFLYRPLVVQAARDHDGSWDIKSYCEWDEVDPKHKAEARRFQQERRDKFHG